MVENSYTHRFVASCPNNGQAILYTLRVETQGRVIMVEDIAREARAIREGFHEAIADHLHARLGGRQVLSGHHHGVDIETVRGTSDR